MSTSTTQQQTIAFFGATGGVAAAALAAALKAGHQCTALVRSETKLTSLLSSPTYGVSETVLNERLRIVEGDARNGEAVRSALISPLDNNQLVGTIVSGIGSAPSFQWSLTQPLGLVDKTICAEFMDTLFSSLHQLASAGKTTAQGTKPLLVTVSTTGISSRKTAASDVPLIWVPLYKWLLHVPHEDKREMERAVFTQADGANVQERAIRDFVVIRPTLFNDAVKGVEKVKSGWQWASDNRARRESAGEKERPAVGYFVGRKDVGEWIFEKLLSGIGENGQRWHGKCVSLTY